MSKPDSWLPLYVADYLADTTRLTTEQHGAYLLIIMDYWRNGAPPNDDAVLAHIARLTPTKWKSHRKVIETFFTVQNGVWRHKRIDEEMAKAVENHKKRSDRAQKGAGARWAKDDTSNASSIASSNGQGVLVDCPLPSPSPTALPTPSPELTLSGEPDVPHVNGKKQKQWDEAREILAFLNEKTGRNYHPVDANLEMIVARLREGFEPKHLRQVIAKKTREWMGNEEMEEYIRPKTLFNRRNFANYSGELGALREEQ